MKYSFKLGVDTDYCQKGETLYFLKMGSEMWYNQYICITISGKIYRIDETYGAYFIKQTKILFDDENMTTKKWTKILKQVEEVL